LIYTRNNKLGIYIPTFNRRKYLKECLESFLPDASKYGIPIYVSDNNSTDGTKDMVAKLKKSYQNIIYTKNGKKYGNTYGSNLINLLDIAETEYFWLFGDDDVVRPGAVQKILAQLKDCEFLQLNIEIWNHDLSKVLLKRKIKNDYSSGAAVSANDAFSNAKYGYAGYMGSIITKTRYLKEAFKNVDKKRFAADRFPHMSLFYPAIARKTGAFIYEPLINYRNIYELTGGETQLWLISYPEELSRLKPYYTDKEIANVTAQPLYSMAGMLSINKLQNHSMIGTYRHYVLINKGLGIFSKALLLGILAMPDSLIKIIISPIMKINGMKMKKVN